MLHECPHAHNAHRRRGPGTELKDAIIREVTRIRIRQPDLHPYHHRLLTDIPFGTTDWNIIERTEHSAESGTAHWRTRQFGAIRVRMVEYSAGYRADHWCEKGHILLCLAGELETELADGRRFHLVAGMSYQVADRAEAHRSSSRTGATLFIVD